MRFVWKYPRLAPQSQKCPLCWMELSARGKQAFLNTKTRSSESAGLELTSYGVTDTIFWGHYGYEERIL
jgi:hypothetical protein